MRPTAPTVGLLCLALGGCGSEPEPEPEPARPLGVMTYNVMCWACGGDAYDPWTERLAYFADIFQRHEPDLIGTQELTGYLDDVEGLLGTLPGFAALYYAPEDRPAYPDAAIFYRKSRFSVLEHGEYWLSPTPDKPSSTGFAKPQLARLVKWALLSDKAGDRKLYFASTHFDNNSPSQELSAPLVLERTAPWVGEHPVLFVGDFNSKPGSTAYSILTTDSSHGFVLENTFDLSPETRVVSVQSPTPAYDFAQRIDHMFVAGEGFQVSDWAVDVSVYGPNDRPPSDHFPMVATVDYP